jgi:hypothetical protein
MQRSRGERVRDVVVPVFQRFADGFADVEVGGEVHDRVVAADVENALEANGVSEAALDEDRLRVDGLLVAGDEVVVHSYLVSGRDQPPHTVTPDISGPADDKDAHGVPSWGLGRETTPWLA